MNYTLQDFARLHRLHTLSCQVRDVSINCHGDLVGWRLSRLLRDAITPADADEAEKQYSDWEAKLEKQVVWGASIIDGTCEQPGCDVLQL